ncbi:MAG: pectinesterase family protein [Verrucomicrobiota bacterium]
MKSAVLSFILLLTLCSSLAQKPILNSVFPEPNTKDVCTDAVIRVRFESRPILGKKGTITIRDNLDNSVVYQVDCSAKAVDRTIGGFPNFNVYPYTINGTEVEIPIFNLKKAVTYRVEIEWSLFPGLKEVLHQNDPTLSWVFSTRSTELKGDANHLIVAADGSGDFCTIQGALDFIPQGNTLSRTIFIKQGIYPEIIAFAEKHNITVIGEDRQKTILAYATNAKFNSGGGNPYATAHADPSAEKKASHIYHRGVFLAHRTEGLTLDNFTIHNTTPQGGSQSEAIILNGTTSARAIVKNLDLYSFQDTLQINGQAYITGCHIEGDVDFMWGTGPCYFKDCTCIALRSNAYYTQIRNPKTNHGYVYVGCRFIGSEHVTGNFLSRIELNRFPFSEVVLLNCILSEAVAPIGWQLQAKGDPSFLHFWEFNSQRTPQGPLFDVSHRLSSSKQLTLPADKALIDAYLDPEFVLGNNWRPNL